MCIVHGNGHLKFKSMFQMIVDCNVCHPLTSVNRKNIIILILICLTYPKLTFLFKFVSAGKPRKRCLRPFH